ncbi:SAM-dependent methyltransferase [Opitutus sp. GAS368]|uniref:class I SAM-dependent methyltransferase n=1 Tax=Opitutus sp. GAS368 TaxID=1882749 RepID=UPI001E659F0D|nr:SAM-dependent methyltransferase [Opitutus sp. GAS368]
MSNPPREDFLIQLGTSVRDGSFVKLTLGKPRGGDATLRNLLVRPVVLRGAPHLSFVWRHDRQDITKNHAPEDAITALAALVGADFHSAHLFTTARMAQLEFNKKGEPRLTYGPAAVEKAGGEHDRTKQRLLPEQSQPWLEKLGVTTATGAVREGLADKHRQIHKFTEILSHLAADAALPTHRPLEIADMGCGKGYLTFATHDYFNLVEQRAAHVRGIEAREELVTLCNRIARETARANLNFVQGTIESARLPALDVLIALHACDTATDDALAKGVQAGAALLVVAPCCQKELRPQLVAAPVLAPALRHGIFQERHAEFATDALRALLLEWAGYDTKVFEFISTEHTAKNLMIAATKRNGPARTESAALKVRELATFYGIKSQALARQFYFDLGT